MIVKIGDRFEVAQSSRTSPLFAEMPKKKFNAPKWIKVDQTAYAFEIVGVPSVDESEKIDTQTIVEFYSR
jgi:ribosomal protein S4